MSKLKTILTPAILVALSTAVFALDAPVKKPVSGTPVVQAQSAVLIDAASGQILWQKNYHTRRPIASTTKVMTVLLALENGRLDKVVTIPAGLEQVPECSLHLKTGEKLPLRSLIYGAMVRSANDAAVAIANHIGGSEEAFVKKMNAKAHSLGLKDTHFVNPNGLNAEGHYSSAYDLAMIARRAIELPAFNQFCDIKRVVIERPQGQDKLLVNKARFLFRYPGADGIKSGYTRQAGRCFVGSATRGGLRLISVALKSNEAGADTQAMMDYGFARFRRVSLATEGTPFAEVPVAGGITHKCRAVLARDLKICVPNHSPKPSIKTRISTVNAPVHRGSVVGVATVSIQGKPVVSVPLVAAGDIPKIPNNRIYYTAAFLIAPLGYLGYRKRNRYVKHTSPAPKSWMIP